MKNNRIEKLVIVGGGTAGWMAAASLSTHFKNQDMAITVVDSSKIGSVGVGEATIPTIRWFIRSLGMNTFDVLKRTQATCKLGIQFEGWHTKGEQFFHPFGLHGQMSNGIPFYQYWLKARKQGASTPIDEYSLACILAKNNKFSQPVETPQSQLDVFEWALHFDASQFSGLMKEHSLSLGVKHIDAKVMGVNQNESNGFIQSLILESGEKVGGDLFIDCTGLEALLIEKTLKTGYEDWSHWLRCNRAIAVQSESVGELRPYTRSIAQESGWQWQIPLQNRVGNGLVYSSDFLDDESALDTLKGNVSGALLEEPRLFQFIPGRRTQAWNKNCISLGLSSGFFEPIESTSIAMIETALERIKDLFPSKACSQAAIDEYNKLTRIECEQVRDFIILHYIGSKRDEPFWEHCRNIEVPKSLENKLSLFKDQAFLTKQRQDIFQNPSWVSILAGMNITPEVYDSRVDLIPDRYLNESLAKMRVSIISSMASVHAHQVFINGVQKVDRVKEHFSN